MGGGELTRQADSDQQLIALWLHGKAQSTQLAYRHESDRLLRHLGKPLVAAKLGDLQSYLESLERLAPATQARATNALKSLFAFGHRVGYLQWNPAAAIKAPKIKNTLAERLLLEEDVARIIQGETHPRDRTILRLFYAGALRVSELCSLRWRDLQPRGRAGQVTIFGKGGKTGVVLLPETVWTDLLALPGDRHPDSPVFVSSRGQHLTRQRVWQIVKRATRRAGLPQASPHWIRHAHASVSLEKGASIALVQQTLRHSSVATTGKYLHARPNESSGDFLGL